MSHMRVTLRGSIVRAATAAFAVASLGACSTSSVLDVTDPDIINIGDVSSAAGADAVRIGALARLATATSGGESFFLLGGLFSDEWNNADTFISRQEIDQRLTTFENSNLLGAVRSTQRARLSAQQAIGLLEQFSPDAPTRDIAEMYWVQAYTEALMAEHLCDGLVFSTVSLDGTEEYGTQITVQAAFERALAHADAGLDALTGSTAADNRIRYTLQVTKGRILLDLDRPAEAAAAVAGVPTGFTYDILHSTSTTENQTWILNNSARRYSVSTVEGGNGIDFATAADPRLPICIGGSAACTASGTTQPRRDDNTSIPLYVQLKWPARDARVSIVNGIEARLIEAEAALGAGNYGGAGGTLEILNALRSGAGVAGLADLTDPGSDPARVDQLFRERAFWMFSTGHRTGDLRRLVKQYGRGVETVFPTGAWHKGGNYGTDPNLPVPQAEENNPNVPKGGTCMNRQP
jgi:hypothetical protein